MPVLPPFNIFAVRSWNFVVRPLSTPVNSVRGPFHEK
jgi:hypothetical protein